MAKNGWLDALPETQTIEKKILFSNQYNTEEGYRIFDWKESIVPNRRFKIGYYLTGDIDALNEAKRSQFVCGYCGHRTDDAEKEFCDQCLGSPHLKESELHLLRMRSIADDDIGNNRDPLSKSEESSLLPQYVEAQTKSNAEKNKKKRLEIVEKCDKSIQSATDERDGLLWLIDNGKNIENVIFYKHSGVFSFGWREPLSASVCSDVLDWISEFPFPYEIKTNRFGEQETLEGY